MTTDPTNAVNVLSALAAEASEYAWFQQEAVDAALRRLEALESFADSNCDLFGEHVRGWFGADTIRTVLPSDQWGTPEAESCPGTDVFVAYCAVHGTHPDAKR